MMGRPAYANSVPNRCTGGIEGAVEALARALTLAEPEVYSRTFVDEGVPMVELLEKVAARGITPRTGGSWRCCGCWRRG